MSKNNRTIFPRGEVTQYFKSEGFSYDEAMLYLKKQHSGNMAQRKATFFKRILKAFTPKNSVNERDCVKCECIIDSSK